VTEVLVVYCVGTPQHCPKPPVAQSVGFEATTSCIQAICLALVPSRLRFVSIISMIYVSAPKQFFDEVKFAREMVLLFLSGMSDGSDR
jgi:hypothetical protein